MHAAFLRAAGQAPQLERVPEPGQPGPGQVLLAMRFAPINPADLLAIAGEYAIAQTLPAILGAEGVGEVIATGEGVSGIAQGDHAIPLTRGNWANYRLLASRNVLRVRPDLPLSVAAMLRINPATAWRLLERVRPVPGSWLLQSGGDTAVARLVAILAKARGASVINVVRHRHGDNEAELRLAEGEGLALRVARLAGAPIAAALDCVAGENSADLASCLAPGGRLIVYGHLSGRPCMIPSGLLTGRDITVSGFSLRPAEAGDDHVALRSLYDHLADTVQETPAIQPIAAILPLTALQDALALARQPSEARPVGRVLLALDQ